MTTVVSRSITAANQFTDSISVNGWFNVSVSGTFNAIVTLQVSNDNSTWRDVATFTVPYEGYRQESEIVWYRIGVKTSQYTSGTPIVRIAHNRAFAT